MDKIHELKAERAVAMTDLKALIYEEDETTLRALSEDDRVAVDALIAGEKRLTKEIAGLQAQADVERQASFDSATARMVVPEARISAPMETNATPGAVDDRTIPANARRVSGLRAFKGPKGELSAYRFGTWFAALNGMPWALTRMREQAIRELCQPII